MDEEGRIKALQDKIWSGSIPLCVELAPDDCRTYDESHPYFIQVPRLSYLPFFLPRIHAFFASALIDPDVGAHRGWFSFEDVPLRWQHPVGLLYDIFSGAEPVYLNSEARSSTESNSDASTLPWRLVVHFTDWPSEHLIPLDEAGRIHHDAFINSVKEADYLRNGTAKAIMSLGKDDSTKLWQAVQKHDLALFNSINLKLLNPAGGIALRHVPIKVYLPTAVEPEQSPGEQQPKASLKVVQALVTPMLPPSFKEPQSLGLALRAILPTLFPSRRSYIHAQAVLHGVVLPLNASLKELMRGAAYADGFLHIAVVMVG